jgi:hypothetical protein
MDASPIPGPTKRLLLDISQASDGRLEGLICVDTAGRWEPFSGLLELLKVIEASFPDLHKGMP